MKIKKIISLMLVACTIMCGCGYSAEEKEAMQKQVEQGKKNAVTYIKEKYGFEVEVIDGECETSSENFLDMTPEPTGNVIVKLKYNNKTFTALVPGDREANTGYDNYQLDEIKSKIKEIIKQETLIDTDKIEVSYGTYAKTNDTENGIVSTKFDGNNIKEVLENSKYNVATITWYSADSFVNTYDELANVLGKNLNYLFVRLRDKDSYNAFNNFKYGIENLGTPEGIVYKDMEENAIFIKEYWEARNGSIYKEEFNLKSIDNIYYMNVGSGSASFKKESIDDISNWSNDGKTHSKVGNSYSVSGSGGTLHIWVKYKDTGYKKSDNLKFISQYKGSDGKIIYVKETTNNLGKNNEYMYMKTNGHHNKSNYKIGIMK